MQVSSRSLALGPALWVGMSDPVSRLQEAPLAELRAAFTCNTVGCWGNQRKKGPGWGDLEEDEETTFLGFRCSGGGDSIFNFNSHVRLTSEHGWG